MSDPLLGIHFVLFDRFFGQKLRMEVRIGFGESGPVPPFFVSAIVLLMYELTMAAVKRIARGVGCS